MRKIHLFKIPFQFSVCVALIALVGFGLGRAEMGPCKDDGYSGMICGSGDGAARVIDGSVSPSKRLALAWRSTGGPPTEMPHGEIRDLVIRIGDGAVLAEQDGEYWEIPRGGHVNRLQEWAAWSPNSRLMIKMLDERFETSIVDLFAFDASDKLTGPFNLRTIMESALRARLKQRGKNDGAYSFRESGGRPFTIDNRGRVHANVMMWVPKDGPESHYEMVLQVTQTGGTLGAKIVSIRQTRAKSSTE